MLATAHSATLLGLASYPVRVEVEAHRGPPDFELVGLAEASVRESRVRVRSALKQLNVDISECVIIINLGPADLRKHGSGFDLAIAGAVLAAMREIPNDALLDVLLLGELSLDGTVHPLRGTLAHLAAAKKRGVKRAIVPRANEAEAAMVDGIEVAAVANLRELVLAWRSKQTLPPVPHQDLYLTSHDDSVDLEEVRGQLVARRALEVVAAGGHNLLMMGPPGAGKTMLARRLPTILPPLTSDEALDVTSIHSVAGTLGSTLPPRRPFRAPHHTVSDVALIGGGGDTPRPGEVSLAHHGVLFLDELAEFKRTALEGLRQPIEDGEVLVSRARVKVTFPARPVLVCATNPCPCGYFGDPSQRCACSRERVRSYRARLSGPLLDRLDVQLTLPPVDVASLWASKKGESSAQVRERVLSARAIQYSRYARGEVSGRTSAALSVRDLERVAVLSRDTASMLAVAMERLELSARACGKIVRVARTIADLAGDGAIARLHMAEAISMRTLDRPVAQSAVA